MPEHRANLLGERTEMALCEVCDDTIDLRDDDHALFAVGVGQGQEADYRVAPLCSVDCGRHYVDTVFAVAEGSNGFVPDRERDHNGDEV